MKVEKIKEKNPDLLCEWMQTRLPESMRIDKIIIGYGYTHAIYRKNYRRPIMDKVFDRVGEAIATIEEDKITLYCPEWYSDFIDLIHGFEAEHTGREVTMRYYEGE